MLPPLTKQNQFALLVDKKAEWRDEFLGQLKNTTEKISRSTTSSGPQMGYWDAEFFHCDTVVERSRLELGTQERNELCAYMVAHFVTRIERGVWFVSNCFVAAGIVGSSS